MVTLPFDVTDVFVPAAGIIFVPVMPAGFGLSVLHRLLSHGVQYDMCDEYREIHENMRYKYADDHAVGCKKEFAAESDKTHHTGIKQHKYKHRQIASDTLHCLDEVGPDKIKIYKPPYYQTEEIYDKFVIVKVIIYETYISKDKYHVDSTYKPDGSLVTGVDPLQSDKYLVKESVKEDRHENKQHKYDIAVFIPGHAQGFVSEKTVYEVIRGKEEQYGSAGKYKFIKTFNYAAGISADRSASSAFIGPVMSLILFFA